MIHFAKIKEALYGQTVRTIALIEELKETDWQLQSRLPGWDVQLLVAHILRALTLFNEYLEGPPPETPPNKDRLTYFHFEGAEMAGSVTHRSLKLAEAITPADTVGLFLNNLDICMEKLESVNAALPMRCIFGTITVSEYAATRVFEIGVHTLDLQASLGLPLELDPVAQEIIVQILQLLLDKPRPPELVNDIDFIEAATGRNPFPGLKLSAFSS
ncbi:MAG: maleylpyruvate isomerase N-terminal domain-containing protein [Chloroflexi bacterium]|uniref:Maleylpyruvate isomerase N-terminal domain-containing protein n=1 Tax=Candidatus Chlorohelix allophototropha TaxID=3003348 RepID=A0A8T7MAH6_9CHLR|nr:maleylpyruvate isomerase N-terminal domain-containing protein [Chloroflexota bacterium]WJW68969.1 maleylpyruvate isomerase N-terminal domain-containing protein [Chloroflexota bacterium L227-S17]